MTDAFAGFDHPLPRPFDPARAERALAALAAEGFTPPPRARAVFESTFGNSPFLARLAAREPATLAEHRKRRAARGTRTRTSCYAGRRARGRRCLRHGHPAPRQAPGGADRGAGRHGRPLERRRSDARAQPVRRRGRRQRTALPPAPGGRARRHGYLRSRAPRSRDGPHRARDGKIRRLRAQLFERRRSHRVLRRGALSLRQEATIRAPPPSTSSKASSSCSRRRRSTAMSSASICGSGPMPARRRSRSRPAPRKTITRAWARTGNAPRSSRRAPAPAIRTAGCAFPEGDRAVRLAAQSRFRGDRGHSLDQAADPRPCRPWRRSRSPATTSSSAAAASARSSSSRRRSS